MLKHHLNTLEESLLAQSKISQSSGNTVHKGKTREHFISDFLKSHLSEAVSIGSGEIINYGSKPSEIRNQVDIVIYRRDYPKLNLGGDTDVFLADSVVSTIEVKSKLTKENFFSSMDVGRNINLISSSRINTSQKINTFPPGIMKYLVAYDGPKKMRTVYNWLDEYNSTNNIQLPMRETAFSDTISSPTLDSIIILGKGFIHFDNLIMRFIDDDILKTEPFSRWIMMNSDNENLLLLFISITWAIVNSYPSNELNVSLYMNEIFDGKEYFYGT